MKLDGKVAVITGASRGIGKAIAETFAREGADIVVNYVKSVNDAKEVVKNIKAMGRRAIAVKADVSKRTEAQRMFNKVLAEFGRVDILVNNAGIGTGGTTLDTSEEDWDRVIAVNFKGPFNCTQIASKMMVEQKSGKIINISSISGLGGAPVGELAYCCAKAALIAMTTVAAQDLGPHGINVNSVAPGWTRTDMTSRSTREKTEELQKLKAGMAAMRRIGEPQDIANAVLFLASDESSFVTGQVLVVDGGRKDFLSHA
ncbi:MAG: 3-oxoacyl-ACP reductase family protein [Candidatus Bathyarchaeia archaeon]|jgi:3-oxoacyl-[acyl-carrier protein] reductase